jgi:xanthine dehydrogenase iron-sulfur cluster and FAD-binding subunit A
MMMAAHALIERADGELSREQVTEALSGHVCRCTGYVKIVDAVLAASRGEIDVEQVEEMLTPEPGEPAVEPKGSPA